MRRLKSKPPAPRPLFTIDELPLAAAIVLVHLKRLLVEKGAGPEYVRFLLDTAEFYVDHIELLDSEAVATLRSYI